MFGSSFEEPSIQVNPLGDSDSATVISVETLPALNSSQSLPRRPQQHLVAMKIQEFSLALRQWNAEQALPSGKILDLDSPA